MYQRCGFTLIELLVVVLIIGILSAVALPQYQVAVQKTRTMRLISLLRSISDAENVYYMANGTYTLRFDDLDISMPAGGEKVTSEGSKSESLTYKDFVCYLRNDGTGTQSSFSAYCNDKRADAPALEKYFFPRFFYLLGRW